MKNFLLLIINRKCGNISSFYKDYLLYCKKREILPKILEGKEDIVAKVLILVALTIVVVDGIIPEYMDIPYY